MMTTCGCCGPCRGRCARSACGAASHGAAELDAIGCFDAHGMGKPARCHHVVRFLSQIHGLAAQLDASLVVECKPVMAMAVHQP